MTSSGISDVLRLARDEDREAFDRILGTRFGVYAAELCYHDNTGQFVALDTQQAATVHMREDALITLSESDDTNFITIYFYN